MQITLDQFRAMIPTNREPEEWYEIALKMFAKYEINTPNRIAGFMAQCAHESADFTRLEENLNYSADALYRVFGKRYFKSKSHAQEYHRQPEKIANYVYMDKNRSRRGALGNVEDGDGWRFRGRGIKQLTGRSNYTAFGNDVGMSAEDAAEYLSTKQGAFESACWFWEKNNLERYADRNDIVGMSKRVNGGKIGLDDRKARYARALDILSGEVPTPTRTPSPRNSSMPILKRGSRGPAVGKLQKALGIKDDGIFGIGTAAALKNFQRANGLKPDGIAGPNTYAKLFR